LIDPYQFEREIADHCSLTIASIIWHTEDGADIKTYLLEQYDKWAHLFSREQSNKLSVYSMFDHTIKLVSGAEAPFGPLCPFSEQELKVLKEWLDRQVEAGKIVKCKL